MHVTSIMLGRLVVSSGIISANTLLLTSLLTNLTVNNTYRNCASRILSSIRHLILLRPQVAAQPVR